MNSIWRVLIILLVSNSVYGQDKLYDVNLKTEIAFISTGIGLNLLGQILANGADKANIEDIINLDPKDLPAFDRGAVDNYSKSAQTVSDIILFTSATIPFLTYLNKKCRSQGSTLGIMAIETFMITNGITYVTKSLAKRYRPYNYNPDVPEEIKLSNGSRLSFFSGHVSNSAAMAFFSAKVITDLHPDMKNKGVVWATAAVIPAAIGYFRYQAGKHFPTDVITGYAIGATIGMMIPQMHLSKNIQLTPYGTAGISLRVNLD